jgi:hypothetical protein
MVAHSLLQLQPVLLLLDAAAQGHAGVGGAVEDVDAIVGALAQGGPALGVKVVIGRRLRRYGGDGELDVAELNQQLGDAGGAVVVDCGQAKKTCQREGGASDAGVSVFLGLCGSLFFFRRVFDHFHVILDSSRALGA